MSDIYYEKFMNNMYFDIEELKKVKKTILESEKVFISIGLYYGVLMSNAIHVKYSQNFKTQLKIQSVQGFVKYHKIPLFSYG